MWWYSAPHHLLSHLRRHLPGFYPICKKSVIFHSTKSNCLLRFPNQWSTYYITIWVFESSHLKSSNLLRFQWKLGQPPAFDIIFCYRSNPVLGFATCNRNLQNMKFGILGKKAKNSHKMRITKQKKTRIACWQSSSTAFTILFLLFVWICKWWFWDQGDSKLTTFILRHEA